MTRKPDEWIRGKWQTLEQVSGTFAPALPGVYVIKFGPEVVYVGQSNNLRMRLHRHGIMYGYARNIRTPWGEFPDSIDMTCKVKISRYLGDWAMWEIRLISKLQPKFNKTFVANREAA